MRTHGVAWSKLYMAVTEMATSSSPFPERVTGAFHRHLRALDKHNMPPDAYERLTFIRRRLSNFSEKADEDCTLDFAPLTAVQAVAIAEDIVSLYDEVAKTDARDGAHA